MRTLIVSGLLALLPACVVAPHKAAWAPVQLSVDTTQVHPDNEVFVYVDDVYRGNLVDGTFRIFLTLESHDLRVHFPAGEPWEQSITLSPADYPHGLTIVVPPPEEPAD